MKSLTPRSFWRADRGAMALTVSQMFLGAVSLGIAMFRGTEVNAAFHYESTLSHADYAASKQAADHARSANIVVNNNVTMGAIMGPRFGVEADNITMDANAAIACPTCPTSPICKVCKQYIQNKPRALVKQIWVRAKQQLLWGTLGKLSGDMDKLSFQQAQGLIKGDVSKFDSQVSLKFMDPSQNGEIWGGGNADVACDLAMKDTVPSPVTGHAFDVPLIKPNLLEGLPKALVQIMPKMICKATSAMQGGGGGGGGGNDGPKFPQIKEVNEATKKDCQELENQVRCATSGQCGAPNDFSFQPQQYDVGNVSATPNISSKAQEFMRCSSGGGIQDNSGGNGYFYRNGGGSLTSCTFDRAKCEDKKLEENTDDYLRDKLGLPKMIGNLAAALGGSETRKPTSGNSGGAPKDFCTCASSSKPVDETMIGISDAVRKIASFGSAQPSEALRKKREYKSCGRWYFPKRNGEFAGTPEDEMPFVAAWKWNQTTKCQGGQ